MAHMGTQRTHVFVSADGKRVLSPRDFCGKRPWSRNSSPAQHGGFNFRQRQRFH